MLFSPEYLIETLKQFPEDLLEARRYWIGFSGGQDSLVLLHALSQAKLKPELIAFHINHSINDESDLWQQRCQELADEYSISFHSIKVDGNHPSGESPEAWARSQRYQAFSSVIEQGDVLILAHHQADQAETLLIQLLRGSGPSGLAAMPFLTEFSSGWVARPLLEISKSSIEKYANDHRLSWIDDPGNQELSYDRNYLRHAVLPLIKRRWPAYERCLSRSATLQAEAASLIDNIASQDLYRIRVVSHQGLLIAKLLELDDTRLRHVLRYWIRQSGYQVPSAIKLDAIINEILNARTDRMPCVSWNGVDVRRYAGEIRLIPSLLEHDPTVSYHWDPSKPLNLDIGTLLATRVIGRGLYVSSAKKKIELQVRFRSGGEKFKKTGNQHRTYLKKYFQEQQVPGWLRDRIPLIYLKEELAAVSDMTIADGFKAKGMDEGWNIRWLPKE